MFCLSSRRATARVFPDGRAEFRADPEWFTDYMRRPTVEWEQEQEPSLRVLGSV
jgi:L(+)-tartrate dehydratase alpha subunit